MAYDANRSQIVLFGGQDVLILRGDTWVWDGLNWSQPPAPSPSPRSTHAMAYDAVRNTVVLFGGFIGGAFVDETWTWNGTAWAAENPGNKPSPRGRHGMAF